MPVYSITSYLIECDIGGGLCGASMESTSADGDTVVTFAAKARAAGWCVGKDANRCPTHR